MTEASIKKRPHLFCLIGEESGDNHAGQVLRYVKESLPDLKITGTGGKKFRELSEDTYFNAEDLSVIGIVEVLRKYGYFKNIMNTLCAKIQSEKPDCLMMVDYAGMNLRVAERTRQAGMKNIYFISPQVWAWRKKRALKMKKLVDLMIVLFPFEKEFYKSYAGMEAECFGHPFVAEWERVKEIPSPFPKDQGRIDIAVLPGSRPGEINRLMPTVVEAMRQAQRTMPEARFWVMKAGQVTEQMLKDMGLEESESIRVVSGHRKEYLYHAKAAWCCSGTASLECAILKTAPIIFYRTSPLNYHIIRMILSNKVIGMPNIVLGEKVFSELIQHEFTPEALLQETRRYIGELGLDSKSHPAFDKIHSLLGGKDVYKSIANRITEFIKQGN